MRRTALSIAVFTLALIAFVSAQQTATTTTTVPNLIRYTGTLKDSPGATSVPTTVGITFAIYKQQDGGAPIWQETQNVTPDANGQYTVLLGTTTATGLPNDLFSQDEQRWLGIQLQGEAEQPRVLMVSVPYAFKAHEAETLGGLPASAFVKAPATDGSGSASNGVPGSTPGIAPTTGTAGKSGLGIDTLLNCATAKNNYVPLFTSAKPPNIVICNSVIYQATNGNIGIGTTTPFAKFDVNDNNNPGYSALSGTTSNSAEVGTYGNNLAASGSGIGTAGHTLGPSGIGVYGFHDSTTGAGIGVSGRTNSSSGVGVLGAANTPTGVASGVAGASASVDGVGVGGLATSTGAQGHKAFGVTGIAQDPNGAGGSFGNLAVTGPAIGVSAATNSSNGVGVYGVGVEASHTGENFGGTTTVGVWGDSGGAAGAGIGVLATADDAQGLFAANNSSTSAAIAAVNLATSGNTAYGVAGTTASTSSVAVFGMATANTGVTFGVYGGTNSTNGGSGVYGQAGQTTGFANGVAGFTSTPSGYGVWGQASSTNMSGTSYGVYGTSANNGGGVVGAFTGVNGSGVVGTANTNGSGFTEGVAGINASTSGPSNGVYGTTASSGGVGGLFENTAGGVILLARVDAATNRFQVDGAGNGFFAGALQATGNGTFGPSQINGNLNVTGTLTKGGGSFKIDDPLDPANKYLSHSFVESPDMMNIYNGSVKLNARGEVWVTMPDYFEALNRDFQYVLTAIGRPQPYLYIAKKMSGNRFKISGGKPNAEVSWQVTGIRHDAWANAYRIPVEEEKPAKERGTYLHPELFAPSGGQSVNARLNRAHPVTQK